MKHACLVQKNNDPNASVKMLLAGHIAASVYDQMNAAMAYVTVAGVRDVLDLMPKAPVQSNWVIGLDDAVSQPGAIKLCRSFTKSTVLVASFERQNLRFHPKMLYLSHSTDSRRSFMMLGSSNLTKKALSGNAESVVVLRAETPKDKQELDNLWKDAWSLGRELEDGELDSYTLKYNRSKMLRKKAMKDRLGRDAERESARAQLILDSDHAEVDPTNAGTCWIECGNVTAMGRELEFKAEQGLFFGLNPHGEEPKFRRYIVSDGSEVSLRMKYQGNHMWRLQMTRDVPEVTRGLRPVLPDGRLGRSPLVAVFERTEHHGTFVLRFVDLGSKEFQLLRQRSIDRGTQGRTSSREYGWY